MGWTIGEYAFWRHAMLPYTSAPADRTAFGAALDGAYEQQVEILQATIPDLGPALDQDISTFFETARGAQWFIVHYDDGTLLGGYDRP